MHSKIMIISSAILLLIFTNPSFAQEDDKLVILNTASGKIVIEFFSEDAPNHVNNFMKLAGEGFYDRTIFHRIIKDDCNFNPCMIQGGDPKTKPGAYDTPNDWGTGGPVYENGTSILIDAEFNNIKHNRGIVSMARAQDPNSAGSQFFIMHNASNFLDGQYTVFGRLVTQESFETLDKIANLETPEGVPIAKDWGAGEILSAEVVNRSDVPDLLELGEPERMSDKIPEIADTEFSNEELGFSTVFPGGWFVQQPEKTSPNTPDVAAVGPQVGGLNPTISVSILDNNGITLDDRMNKIKESLENQIDSNQFEIISEEKTTINNHEALTMISRGIFPTPTEVFTLKFIETTIAGSDKFFVVTYVNTEENFEANLEEFGNAVNSFVILGEESSSEKNQDDLKNGGGCLIATATFGSELSPQVQMLRELRDNTVLNTASGTSFMMGFNQFYYSFSPAIADLERENKMFKETVKLAITPMLTTLSILNYIDIDSEEEMLGYGIGIILLNLGLYFVAPTIIIHDIRKRISQNSFSSGYKSSEI
jgi:peptidyl-prolyl cis-trans isomerase B (cyclophilin B)